MYLFLFTKLQNPSSLPSCFFHMYLMAERGGVRNPRTKLIELVCLLNLILGLNLSLVVHLRTQHSVPERQLLIMLTLKTFSSLISVLDLIKQKSHQ